MKKILILSDNIEVIVNFLMVLKECNLNVDDFDFSCSDKERANMYAQELKVKMRFLNLKEPDVISDLIKEYNLIISLHCQQLFPETLVKQVRCVNIHPGYLPDNRGWYPHIFSIINNRIAGVTIHEITGRVDAGPIIARKQVDCPAWYTSLELYRDILLAEKELIKLTLLLIINHTYTTQLPEASPKLILKKDFEEIKKLNLEENSTWGTVINRLRGLSHGSYRNAFFIDPKTQRKVYVRIVLEVD
jgi:dTDP-4-amino-4,6-dideoxyglucose formyltransferase